MTTNAMSTDNKVLAKQTRSAFERLNQLEQLTQVIINGANQALERLGGQVNQLDAKVRAQNELLRAAVDLLGVEAIDARVLVNREADAVAQAEREKQELEMLKSQGIAKEATEVPLKGLVTGVEKKTDGTVKHPGYTQAFVEGLPKELQDLLVGKKVGDSVTLPGDSGTFEIGSIFELVPPKMPEAPAAATPEATPVAAPEVTPKAEA